VLEGKKRLHHLPPESGLIPAEPLDEFVVQVGQTQIADRDIPRRAGRAGEAGFWGRHVGVLFTGEKRLSQLAIPFGARARSALPF
jgi:hypothetical protein